MDVYKLNLGGLVALCAALFVAQRKPAQKAAAGPTKKGKGTPKPATAKAVDGAEAVQWDFLIVYALVMGADWLQVRRTPLPSVREAS